MVAAAVAAVEAEAAEMAASDAVAARVAAAEAAKHEAAMNWKAPGTIKTVVGVEEDRW